MAMIRSRRGAPHLVIAHIPENNPVASVDAIIALTHFDLTAPAFGVGTCWAGFLSMAATVYEPLQKVIALPPGRKYRLQPDVWLPPLQNLWDPPAQPG